MNRFDVLIVGAGPAGSFAAERLARAHVRVALIDGRPPGDPKACGGGVTSKALKAWPYLLDAVGRTIDELDMYSPSGKHLHLKLDEPFAIYSRNTFDTFLCERARQAGAAVFADKVSAQGLKPTNHGWSITTKAGEEFDCKYLVGADGANSAIAKKLAGPLPAVDMEVAFGYRAPLPRSLPAFGDKPVEGNADDAPAVVAFLPKWVGYAWAFPRIDHVSFGIATTQDAFDHEKLDALLWEFMISYYDVAQSGQLRKMKLWTSAAEKTQINNLRDKVERYAARIPGLAPRTWSTRKTCGESWALLGDAAGFADPVTGEGIYYALRSAELFVDAYAAGDSMGYERLWRADFGADLLRASQMRRRFYGNFWGAPFTDRMIRFAKAHRGIRKVLGQLVAGDQGYVDLKKKLARSALRPL